MKCRKSQIARYFKLFKNTHATWNNFLENQIFTLEFLASLIVEIIGGFLFLIVLLFLLRPKVTISPQIAKHTDNFDLSRRTCWVFKVVNKSYFSAFDVQVELMEQIIYAAHPSGNNVRVFPIELKLDKVTHVAPFRPSRLGFYKDYSDYAMRFRTYEDLDAILSNPTKSLQLKVTLKHGLTGLGKIVTKQYIGVAIRSGQFVIGSKFDIL